MVSFAQPTMWQIKYLVVGLSKKNYKSSVQELHHLIERFGYEAQVFLFRTLIEETELRDARQAGGGREQLKLQLLTGELRLLENEEQFGSLLCHAAEGAKDGVSEDFLTHFCKVTKLPLRLQIALGLACQHSVNPHTHREGMKFLKARLKEQTGPNKQPCLPEVTLHAVLSILSGNEMAEVLEEQEKEKMHKNLCDAHPDIDFSKGPCAGQMPRHQRLTIARLNREDSYKSTSLFLPDLVKEKPRVAADLLAELGNSFTRQNVKDVMGLVPNIGTAGLAEIVGTLVQTAPVPPSQQNCGLAAGCFGALQHDGWNDLAQQADANADSSHDGEPKDIMALIDEVKTCVPTANWPQVFDHLFELDNFKLPDLRSFESLTSLLRATCGEDAKFPTSAVLHRRRNSQAQLSFLKYAISADVSIIDFSEAGLIDAVPGLDGAEDAGMLGGANHCWACSQFIEVLLELAAVEDHGGVMSLFEAPLESMPQTLLVGLFSAKDRSNGALRSELFDKLVPPIFNLDSPNATLMQETLAKMSPRRFKSLVKVMKDRSSTAQVAPSVVELLPKDELPPPPAPPPVPVPAPTAAAASTEGPVTSATLPPSEPPPPPPSVPPPPPSMPVPAPQERPAAVGAAPPDVAPPPPPPPAPEAAAAAVQEERQENDGDTYFAKLYRGEMSPEELVTQLQKFQAQPADHPQRILYQDMMRNFFSEFRLFSKYPAAELHISGMFFGMVLNRDLVTDPSLIHSALTGLNEALKQPPAKKMFRFAITALEQMFENLVKWPGLCVRIIGLESIRVGYPAYARYAEDVLRCLPQTLHNAQMLEPDQLAGIMRPALPAIQHTPPAPQTGPPPPAPPQTAPPPPNVAPPQPTANVPPEQPPQPPPREPPPRAAAAPTTTMPQGPPPPPRDMPDVRAPREPVPTAGGGEVAAAPSPGSTLFGGAQGVESFAEDPELTVERPPIWFSDQTAQLFNSLVKDNVSHKAEELSGVLIPEYHAWFACYMVKHRATKEVNFHGIYIELLEHLKQPRLFEETTNMTYSYLRSCLRSVDQAVVSTSHRTVLKNLGSWLGKITISRNKPLKSKQMDMKQYLLEAYEQDRLTAILPLVCKVLEGVKDSKVYKLPNPWTSAIMSLLAEIHDVPNLRTNLMFEVEVLCKHLDIKLQDLKRGELLVGRRPATNTNDYAQPRPGQETGRAEPTQFNAAGAAANQQREQREAAAAGAGSAQPAGQAADNEHPLGAAHFQYRGNVQHAGLPEYDYLVPTMPSLATISPNIAFFHQQRHLVGLVPIALDKALREVINAVVERTVMIACLNTRELVQKDFAMEGDDKLVTRAAELMVATVAGSLALITVREPLRVAMQNHLWTGLCPHLQNWDSQQEMALLESVVSRLVQDNLDLGCNMIEKTVVDKAMRDIRESINPAIQARRNHRMRGSREPFFDPNFRQTRWPQALPEVLRPRTGGTPQHHLKVYKDFNNMRFNSGGTPAQTNLPDIDLRLLNSPSHAQTEQAAAHAAGMYGERGNYGYPGLEADAYAAAATAAEPAEPEIGSEVLRVVTSVLNVVDNVLQAMIEDPPLLPPIDILTVSAFRQDDSVDACQALSLLPLNSDLVNLLRTIPHRLGVSRQSQAEAPPTGQGEACAQELAYRTVKRMFEAPQLVSQLRPPDSISPIHMVTEVYLAILDILKETLRENLNRTVLSGVEEIIGRGIFNVDVVSGLVRCQLLNLTDLERLMGKWLDTRVENGMVCFHPGYVDFVLLLLNQLLIRQRVIAPGEVRTTVEHVHRLHTQARTQAQQQNLPVMETKAVESMMKFLEEFQNQPRETRRRQGLAPRLVERLEEDQRRGSAGPDPSEATIIRLYDEWFQVMQTAGERELQSSGRAAQQLVANFLQSLGQAGVLTAHLTSDEPCERFLRIACEHAVQRVYAAAEAATAAPAAATEQEDDNEQLNFASVDYYARLITTMMRFSDKVQMLQRALNAIGKAIVSEAEAHQERFNQRPYFRILLTLLLETSSTDPAMEQVNFQVLVAFCNLFNQTNPLRVPSFAFAWFELVSNRLFMTKLLQMRQQKGWPMLHRFVSQMLYFLEPFIRHGQMNAEMRTVYKNMMRMLNTLQYEHPEFVCDYHYTLVENCHRSAVQIRNLILAQSPASIRQQDPRDPHSSANRWPFDLATVDALQESKQSPRLLTDYCKVVEHHGVKFDVDLFMRTRDRNLIEKIMEKLLLPKAERADVESKYNIPLLNAFVLYLSHLQKWAEKRPAGSGASTAQPPYEVFLYMSSQLDHEGRYYFFSSMANHLRYPNYHTSFFCKLLLHLYERAQDTSVREQIARVLVERLLACQPHPWGLTTAFMELARKPEYDLWNQPFVHVTPEVESLFIQTARSIGFEWPDARR